jgi:CBS domain-containing protein
VRPDTSLKDAAAILAEHRIGGLPVVDDGSAVLGVITCADILLKERAESPAGGLRKLLHDREAKALEAKVEAHTVGEAMSTPPITAEENWLLSEAADEMLERGVNRLPVVEHDRLVGIITRHDLVRAFARGDAEIERDIRDEALLGLSWPDGLDVKVENGEVTLRGDGFALTGAPRGGAAAGPVVATIRPEDIVVGDAGANRMEAVVEVVEYHGREQAVQARLAGGQAVHFRTDKRLAPHDAVVLSVPSDRVLVFPADSPAAPEEAA